MCARANVQQHGDCAELVPNKRLAAKDLHAVSIKTLYIMYIFQGSCIPGSFPGTVRITFALNDSLARLPPAGLYKHVRV